jgi:hypothetical protein
MLAKTLEKILNDLFQKARAEERCKAPSTAFKNQGEEKYAARTF